MSGGDVRQDPAEQSQDTADAMQQIQQLAFGDFSEPSEPEAAATVDSAPTPPTRGRKSVKPALVVLGAAGVVAGLAALVWTLWLRPDWREVVRSDSFPLTPEAASCLGVENKVDLDTGRPGHGEQLPASGCESDGGLAELIIDESAIRTPGPDRGRLFQVDRGRTIDADTCDGLINDSAGAAADTVPRNALNVGDQLCVRTDEGRTALVTFTGLAATPGEPTFIDFVVWEKA